MKENSEVVDRQKLQSWPKIMSICMYTLEGAVRIGTWPRVGLFSTTGQLLSEYPEPEFLNIMTVVLNVFFFTVYTK